MKRDLSPLQDTEFDALVVGGGIHGACIARDAALRGLRVALVERDDFGGATSHSSYKIAHGGIRYLQHLDFARVRASIRERRMWLRTAPHLVRPLEFVMPTYGSGTRSRPALAAAFALYNTISFDRNSGVAGSHAIPPSRTVGSEECRKRIPWLGDRAINGGAIWSDGQIVDADRVIVECLADARAAGATIVNYCEVEQLLGSAKRIHGAVVRDRVADETIEVRAHWTINAAGPWVWELLERSSTAIGSDFPKGLSLGMNLIVPDLGLTGVVGAPGPEGRIYFAMPWQGRTILGTAHWPGPDSPGPRMFNEDDVVRFLREMHDAMPGLPVRREDVQYCYAGLTPLDEVEEGGRLRRSRKSVVHDHQSADGVVGLLSVRGIKFTTARLVAEETIDHLVARLDRRFDACSTMTRNLPGAAVGSDASLEGRIRAACRSEWVVHLEDVVLRRVHAELGGRPTDAQLALCVGVVAESMEWTADRRAEEQRGTLEALRRQCGGSD